MSYEETANVFRFQRALLCLLVPLVLAAACCRDHRHATNLDRAPGVPDTVQTPGLAHYLSEVIDALIAKRLAAVVADAEIDALRYRLTNYRLSREETLRSRESIARCLLFRRQFQDASEELARLAPELGDARLDALAQAAAAAAQGEWDAALESAGSVPDAEREWLAMFGSPPLPSTFVAPDPVTSLATAWLRALADPTWSFENPVGLLEHPCENSFCYYDPFALQYLSALYGRSAALANPAIPRPLSDVFANRKEVDLPPPLSDADAEELLLHLILRNSSGSEVTLELRQALEAMNPDLPEYERHVVQGYLALIAGDTDSAYEHLHEYALRVDPGQAPRSLRTVILMDYAAVAYRTRSIHFATEWVLDRKVLTEEFSFLCVPYFYFSWLQREGFRE